MNATFLTAHRSPVLAWLSLILVLCGPALWWVTMTFGVAEVSDALGLAAIGILRGAMVWTAGLIVAILSLVRRERLSGLAWISLGVTALGLLFLLILSIASI
jgi:hypothetical protein